MKKIIASLSLALIAVVSCVGLVGCKKDTAHPQKYVGTYRFSSTKCLTGDVDISEEVRVYLNNTTVTLNKDGSVTTDIYNDFLAKYEIENADNYTVDYKINWFVKNNRLYLSYDYINVIDKQTKELNVELTGELLNSFANSIMFIPYWVLQNNVLIGENAIGELNINVRYIK